jgi:hypothetical protein
MLFGTEKGSISSANTLLHQNYRFYISALSVANVYYICKIRKHEKAAFEKFMAVFKMVDLTGELIRQAYKASTPDLEDGIQIVSCMEVSDTFITRNKSDFSDYDDVLNILTPEEFLAANAL